MNVHRQEIRTGLLVLLSLAGMVGLLLYLGAPGVFIPQNTYHIYFDNAGAIKHGADVMFAGRKVGQVASIFSPVPENQRPEPRYEVRIDVWINSKVKVYKSSRVQLVQTSLLGDLMIDFYGGTETDGVAPNGFYFEGGRALGLNDAAPLAVQKLDPVLKTLDETLKNLQVTLQNVNTLTASDGDLPKALAEFRKFGGNLNQLSGPDGSLRKSLAGFEKLAGEGGRLDKTVGQLESLTEPGGPLALTLKNAEQFTRGLAGNRDLAVTLRNFRRSSDSLSQTVDELGPRFGAIGHNLEQASDTVKHQPWRLIWPTTKKYPEDRPPAATPRPVAKAGGQEKEIRVLARRPRR
ncbi:MAG: mce related protein [Chthoniobacteraceae bacterium]|nr:mce related protein [Chthoniobacteraceae bacterium]